MTKTERVITVKISPEDLDTIEDALYAAGTSYLETARSRLRANAPKAAELWRVKARKVRDLARRIHKENP